MRDTTPKPARNKEIIRKRIGNPRKWSLTALAKHYNMSEKTGARTIHQIIERDIEKYATPEEIERYRKAIVNTKVFDYGEVIHTRRLASVGK